MPIALHAGVLVAAFAASPRFMQDGFEAPCEVDPDADRLANCVEQALLTSPFDPDTDGDGLPDGDETLGTPGGLDLPGMGVSPRRRDLLLEIDWVVDNNGCALHSHKPAPEEIAGMQAFFADVPLDNPDGSSGIHLIVDHGQGGPFTEGRQVAGPPSGNISQTALEVQYLPAHLASERLGYFRYSLHAHHLGGSDLWGGVATGDANLVTLGCSHDWPGHARNATVHELGHNLGLMHGGDTACNNKPNYNSIMNYNHVYYGIDLDCDRFPDGIDHIAFSRGERNTLVKASLFEPDGVCPSTHPQARPVDWNVNGVIDAAPISLDLACPATDVIRDFDDVGALRLPLRTPPGANAPPPSAPGEPCPVPPTP